MWQLYLKTLLSRVQNKDKQECFRCEYPASKTIKEEVKNKIEEILKRCCAGKEVEKKKAMYLCTGAP